MKRLLIANRGEIAIRIARACREHGIESVAVYSDADANAPHVAAADLAIYLGPTPAAESYLNISKIIAAARESGSDAIHPGYGFLSENPNFVEACQAAGLTFVGPSADSMRALGDKASAKHLAIEAEVPTVPEWKRSDIPASAYPVLIKASAGGGGRGMRVVETANDLAGALEAAQSEAEAGFGDGTLLVESLVRDARHVEVQILADQHGHCIALGDRDCSMQRRHQKVIEEAPAPNISDLVRSSMHRAAVRLAKASGYSSAGTAEFLLARDGSFYFLELNARLQVEHPATELAYGVDIVGWQLRIATGDELTLQQDDIVPIAHAIEARVYAEDPVQMLPTGGRMVGPHLPAGPEVRTDHALADGAHVSLAYDPLLAKVICVGADRESARRSLIEALRETSVPGVITNTPLLIHALSLSDFATVSHSVETLGSHPLTPEHLVPDDDLITAARLYTVGARSSSPYSSVRSPLAYAPQVVGDQIWVRTDIGEVVIAREQVPAHAPRSARHSASGADHAALEAPMPGTVLRTASPGDAVEVGDPVVVLEAMKMENIVASPIQGTVSELTCSVGDLVTRGDVLAEVSK